MPDDMLNAMAKPTVRVDGAAKVTGLACFPSDEPVENPAYAYLVTSTVARAEITSFDLAAAKAVPGVLDILTHENVGRDIKPNRGFGMSANTTTLEGTRVWHQGQTVAVVIAETFEAARDAAARVVVHYETQEPSAGFGSPGAHEEPATPMFGPLPQKGDFDAAFAAAPVRVEAEYETPTQHHNAIELFTTTCFWEGDTLTVYEPSQYIYGSRAALAEQFEMAQGNVRYVSRFIGGGFGSKGPSARTGWIALAAKRLGRPVKLVTSRQQGFTTETYRAETRQTIKLGATRDGRLTALRHEGWELTSRPSGYNVAGVGATATMYACDNIQTAVNVVHADRNTPGFMRAPPEVPYMFALESAMDELAFALKMDPIELRRINDTQVDPAHGHPYSSRSLMQCYDQAAERFGWSERNPEPRSMSDGDWLVGYGCATATYPANVGPASIRLTLSKAGTVIAELAGHELGTGAYTVVAITVARQLGLEVADVTVHMGDSTLPPVALAGGSNNAATISNVSAIGCESVRRRLAEAAVADMASPFGGKDAAVLRLEGGNLVGPGNLTEPLVQSIERVGGTLTVEADYVPQGLPPEVMDALRQGQAVMLPGHGRQDATTAAFGAHLVEIRVNRHTREIRVPRIVSAFAAGTIINPMAARSQYLGGAIWGVSSALHEATEIDRRSARYVNHDLGEYLVPVNADIPSIKIIMVPETDTIVNPLGIKGIGEIGIVGMNAAIANAVFHATGQRIRKLPIRLEKLL
ncbi:xanthine dehydrogenase family protein molybdopterin-binding subunit [Aurantimonas sp. MSK8Z-1]|uniref:xanthine dehydrogenase family protein molybdopterin-binding subunit n=1 Tax=Mangrovibrevibacter kandeliae TaxID=2968473 RepID=UPI002119427A|nr:xanthine dehydrogenase family protein molybdopterin-binding subunit [Aurantimonas sp. MSK8Z-1]MCW4113923.1 xanthine dehydrogenase family protein molybdopterin-binding subunit [Aurantimonas sp. MSK8Z-1]